MPEGVDRSSQTAAEQVERMARVGSCSSPSFSPDGERLAFVSNLSGVPQVWTVATACGWPRLVTTLADTVQQVEWSPSGDWLAVSAAPGGGMNGQIYLVRPDGTDVRRITPGGREGNFLGPWLPDGSGLIVGSNRERPDHVDAYIYDLKTGDYRLVARNPGRGSIIAVSRDGRQGILHRVANRSDSNLYLLDLATSEEHLLTSHDGPGSFGPACFSPDGRAIYLASDAGRDLRALARIRLDDSGVPGPIEIIAERDDAELHDVEMTHDGTALALLWNVAGRDELSFYDVASDQIRAGSALPVEVVGGSTFSFDGSKLAIAGAGAAQPVDIWLFDMASGDWTQLTESPHAGVDLSKLVRPELVRFPAHDGLELSGWLYRPAGATGPGPIVLDFHGGPEGQSRPVFSPTYQALLSQGIAVLSPNVRGSSGFGKRFVNLDNGALRWDGIKDIGACLDYVIGAGIADPARIGISGGSYGGYMTMAGLAHFPERFAAGANLYGVVNFETFFKHTEPWMAAISKIEYGDPDTEAEMLRDLSPITHIDRVTAPTLVLHGANDTNVPVVEAEQVVERLRARDIPVDYILFPDEGHGFRKEPNRIRSAVAVVEWFRRYLTA